MKGKRKNMKTVWIIALAAAVLAAAVWILYAKGFFFAPDKGGMIRSVPQPGELTACSFTLSGDSLGSYYQIAMQRCEDGTADITIKEQESAHAECWQQNKKVSNDLIQELSSLVRKYDMTQWKDLPLSEIQALDAATATVHFTVDGKDYTFSDTLELPVPGALREIRGILEDYSHPER